MTDLSAVDQQVARLRRRIADTEDQLRNLKIQLQRTEAQAQAARDLEIAYAGGMPQGWQHETMAVLSRLASNSSQCAIGGQDGGVGNWPLTSDEYQRYGRQLILPQVGLQGQLRLKKAKVLIIGVGGLGCPAAAYLAGAGVGTLGFVDGDEVEKSNLHRQIAHSTSTVGLSKVDSATKYVKGLNPNVNVIPHPTHITPQDALEVIEPYDIVLDCTDHPTSRYLISDACVLLGKPLVSASALKTEGQLLILNNPPAPPGSSIPSGPCYRCIWPKPPPAESVVSCGEGGILGPVVGAMGVLQALEALKILSAGIASYGPDSQQASPPQPSLLMFSAFSSPPFRSVRLRGRRHDCASCSAHATISRASLASGSLDYVAFCGVANPIDLLRDDERISVSDLARHWRDEGRRAQDRPVLLDVRDRTQFEICHLPGSVNVPWADMEEEVRRIREGGGAEWIDGRDVAVVCRLGNDSQLAVRMIKDDAGLINGNVVDVKGGWRAWRESVDPSWPDY